MLKLFAALFMVLDHIGFYYYDMLPDFLVLLLRTIGRLAFPVFAWSIARGFARTRNLINYFARMVFFAGIAELVIRLADRLIGLTMDWTNVLITFSLAIVALTGYRLARDASLDVIASLRPIPASTNTAPVSTRFDVRVSIGGITLDARLGVIIGYVAVLLAVAGAEWLKADYGAYGIFTVLGFYIATDKTPEDRWEQRMFMILAPVNLLFLVTRTLSGDTSLNWAMIQLFSLMAIPIIIAFRKEKRPPVWQKYAFYLFYPVHILILCAIRYLFIGPLA
ncbi:MAG: TraX family protein [Eubacteriales bacterium]|nr:TraX family protein [Eubacteriales bacterium]